MSLWKRLFGRTPGRKFDASEPALLGGMQAIAPAKFMSEITQLGNDVENALQSNHPRLISEVAARVESMIQLCQQFVQLGDFTYVETAPGSFARVDMSKRQELATRMLPLLEGYRNRLRA